MPFRVLPEGEGVNGTTVMIEVTYFYQHEVQQRDSQNKKMDSAADRFADGVSIACIFG